MVCYSKSVGGHYIFNSSENTKNNKRISVTKYFTYVIFSPLLVDQKKSTKDLKKKKKIYQVLRLKVENIGKPSL